MHYYKSKKEPVCYYASVKLPKHPELVIEITEEEWKEATFNGNDEDKSE